MEEISLRRVSSPFIFVRIFPLLNVNYEADFLYRHYRSLDGVMSLFFCCNVTSVA